MYKRLKIIYPNLKLKMAERDNNPDDLAKITNTTVQTVRRKLKGDCDFKLNEVKTLADYYKSPIEHLFYMSK